MSVSGAPETSVYINTGAAAPVVVVAAAAAAVAAVANEQALLCLSENPSDRGWLWCRHRHGKVLQHQVPLLRPEAPCGGAGGHSPGLKDARRRANGDFPSAS